MCGIVGYISKYPETYKPHREGFLRDALIMDSLRGMHSTGVMSIHDDFRIDWLKQSVNGMKFVTGEDYKKHDSNGWCAVGHNRHATMGGLNTDSAHPFDEGDVTLVHNGTLRSLKHMDGYDASIQVDSQQIARTMSLASPDDAHKVIEQLHGAFALVWFDMRDKSINIVRNSERPLHLGIGSSDNIMYLMSEGHMLYALGARFKNAPRISHVYQIRANQMMKFHKGVLIPEVREVKPYVPKTYSGPYSGGYWSEWNNRALANGSKDKKKETGNEQSKKNSSTATTAGTEKSTTCIKSEVLERGKLYPSSDWPLTGVSPMRRPGAVQAQMLSEWYWFLPHERLVFYPQRFESWGRHVGMVIGKVYHPEWDCDMEAVVYNISQHEWNSYGDRLHWITTPVGINHTDLSFEVNAKNNGVPQPITYVMAKVVTFEPMPSRYLPAKLRKSHDVTFEADTELDDDDAESDWVDGPRGPIHPDKFLELVKHGCANCSCDLDVEDADEIVWLTDQTPDVPICWSCAEELTEEEDE